MRLTHVPFLFGSLWTLCAGTPGPQVPLVLHDDSQNDTTISPRLFAELEELARLVDISYCVGISGIQKPFECASRCKDFPTFELVTTWNTGILLSDSCGYIALDHDESNPRIIVAFRGTYSLSNTIADLSTVPQKYVPYPDGDDEDEVEDVLLGHSRTDGSDSNGILGCYHCEVHSGFLRSWRHTRSAIYEDLSTTISSYPSYKLHLVGHSLGGAISLLAGLDLAARGFTPQVTTFGEPRVGNAEFVNYVDTRLDSMQYRRVTHVDDPVPLLPLTEWGFLPHAGEIYISKSALPPDVSDVSYCKGNGDERCSAQGDSTLASESAKVSRELEADGDTINADDTWSTAAREAFVKARAGVEAAGFPIPTRLKFWQLFFAHRDYFWRLGLCTSYGDPWDWKGQYQPQDEADG